MSVWIAYFFPNLFNLLFSLFFLLFIGPIALIGTIYGFYCTISTNFCLYLQYFHKKVVNFSKISRFQIDPASFSISHEDKLLHHTIGNQWLRLKVAKVTFNLNP